jgi:ribosomal protein S18 acetylase RimI-like enzyme
MFRIRPATAGDVEFVVAMFLEAVNWDPEQTPLDRDAVLADPVNRRYVEGWPRGGVGEGDVGVVAVGEQGAPVGACWWRYFTRDAPGYGFVADDVPEIAIGVVAGWRGRGVGRMLLDAIAGEARTRGIRALSLSVEHGNPAQRLYERAGYREVERRPDGITMVLDLR